LKMSKNGHLIGHSQDHRSFMAKIMGGSVLRIRIRCFFTPWIRDEFFWISDPVPFF
jgi:hypothetical protein